MTLNQLRVMIQKDLDKGCIPVEDQETTKAFLNNEDALKQLLERINGGKS